GGGGRGLPGTGPRPSDDVRHEHLQ
ncbi:MAG: hypothetical protein AVDCRST_MAG27-732, partial [uncultured Craurococcus sp.]